MVSFACLVFVLQNLNLISSQSVDVVFENITDIKYLTSMNDNKPYNHWFEGSQCSVTSYNSNDDYYWLSVQGALNGNVDVTEIMSDIYDININHYNDTNLPFIIPDVPDMEVSSPKLGRSTISNTIIQCYVYPIPTGNFSINCIIFNETITTFSSPFIVSNSFEAGGDPYTDKMFWGFDILCFDDDTFLISYIDSGSLFYTLLYSNGTIIIFNKLLYSIDIALPDMYQGDGVFLVKSYFNLDSIDDFINSFLLFWTDPSNAIGVWTGVYLENYSLKLNYYEPIIEMVEDAQCKGQRPILMNISDTCCYIMSYGCNGLSYIGYIVINATGHRVIVNDYILYPYNNMYRLQTLIPLQYKSNNYFLSLMPFYDVSYLNLYGYIFNLTKLTNNNPSYNQYEINIIGKQVFVKQWYNNSNNNVFQIYGFCATFSNNNKQLFLSWIADSCYGNPNWFISHIYAQSWNISWY